MPGFHQLANAKNCHLQRKNGLTRSFSAPSLFDHGSFSASLSSVSAPCVLHQGPLTISSSTTQSSTHEPTRRSSSTAPVNLSQDHPARSPDLDWEGIDWMDLSSTYMRPSVNEGTSIASELNSIIMRKHLAILQEAPMQRDEPVQQPLLNGPFDTATGQIHNELPIGHEAWPYHPMSELPHCPIPPHSTGDIGDPDILYLQGAHVYTWEEMDARVCELHRRIYTRLFNLYNHREVLFGIRYHILNQNLDPENHIRMLMPTLGYDMDTPERENVIQWLLFCTNFSQIPGQGIE